MNVKLLIGIVNIAALVLGGLAVANTFPTLTPVFSGVSGALLGWVNLHKPKSAEVAK